MACHIYSGILKSRPPWNCDELVLFVRWSFSRLLNILVLQRTGLYSGVVLILRLWSQVALQIEHKACMSKSFAYGSYPVFVAGNWYREFELCLLWLCMNFVMWYKMYHCHSGDVMTSNGWCLRWNKISCMVTCDSFLRLVVPVGR